MSEPTRRFQPESEESLFPLAPFLTSLETIGIRATLQDHRRIALALRAGGRWNTRQLCGVLASLLVRDPEKEEPFRQHFARFFSLAEAAQEPFAQVDLERALEDLRGLKEGGPTPAPAAPRLAPVPLGERTTPERRLGWKPAVALLSTILIAISGIVIWKRSASPPPSPQPARPAPQGTVRSQAPAAVPPSSPPVRLYPEAVSVRVRRVPPDRRYEWRLAGVLLLAAPSYGLWLWWLWRRRKRGPILPEAGEGLPRLFRPDEIGGVPDSLLDRETLDRLADSLGYFRSDVVGRELDVRASIETTARWGGVPCPVFATRRQIRSVILLEDLFAEARSWNTVAAELAAGLAQRGVPLLHGFFRGILDRFRLEDGLEIHLEDLEDDRRGYLVLVFTDGKGLASPRATLALETLARWPQVAWMQLEEPRAWDQSAAFAARQGLRVFPASRAGLLQVVDRFTSELAADPATSTPPERWRGLPPRPLAGRLAEYVETLLGDSLLWAQACAMVTPPFSLGLADRVRERFHPSLPPERRQRLLALPGTLRSAGGLTFSREVTAVLREGFRLRRSSAAQDEVLAFLVERIREAEPPEPESRAHQAWEWRLERVRLEHDPDPAIERLAVLSQGPLRRAIREDLSALQPAPASWGPEPVSIPLPVRPKSRRGRRLLRAVLDGRDLVPPSLPVLWQRAAVLAAGCFLIWLAVWLIMAWVAPKESYITVRSGEKGLRGLARLEMRVDQGWKPVGGVMQLDGNREPPFFSGLPGDNEYRLFVLANSLNLRFLLPKARESLDVSVVHEPRSLPCTETVPHLGLTIERCLNLAAVTRDRTENGIRIGLFLDTGKVQKGSIVSFLRGSLGLDILYTLRIQGRVASLEKGIERIVKDWEPWTDNLTLAYEGDPRLLATLSLDKVFGPPYKPGSDERIQLFGRRRDQYAVRVVDSLNDLAAYRISKEPQGKAILQPAAPKGSEVQRNTNPGTAEFSRERLSWNVGETVHEDLAKDILASSSLPPGVSLNRAEGRLEGVPTEAGTWDVGISISDDPSSHLKLPWRRFAIEVRDPRCPNPGETLCGKECIEMQRLSPPFHDGACFTIAYSLQKASAEKVDEPPPWNDESLQPRHYYRLYYEWNESRTGLIVRSLPSAKGWDRGPEPPMFILMSVQSLMARGYQFLPTDLEVHCAGGMLVASASSAERPTFEKVSPGDPWAQSRRVGWANSPKKSTDQDLTLFLTQVENLCAKGH